MDGLIIVGVPVAAVALAIVLLRVPAALAFFSLLVGQSLVIYAADDVHGFVATLFQVSTNGVKAGLTLLPLGLTLLFLRGRVGSAKIILEIIPAVLTGLVTVMVLYPYIPDLQRQIGQTAVWQNIELYKGLIVFGTSLASLLTTWFTYPKAVHHRRRRWGKREE